MFQFGEKVAGYDYRVINEREARASAGIMFVLGFMSLMSVFGAFGSHTLFWAELFAITFIFEFFVRIFISIRYAPYMLLGSIIVSNQHPDWVEAAPKKFAWSLGLILGLIMAYFIVANIYSPLRFLTCVICLVLLYLESSFGICLGCLLYKKLGFGLKGNCPGGTCETPPPKRIFPKDILVLLLSFVLFYGVYYYLDNYKYYRGDSQLRDFENDDIDTVTSSEVTSASSMSVPTPKTTPVANDPSKKKDCTPPQWAIDMGHKELWKKHHGCN